MRHWLICAALGLCACSEDTAPPPSAEMFAPSSPEAQGIESTRLRTLVEDIAEADLGVHSLLIARHGKIVLDATFFPYDGVRAHDVASCTKSLTSTAVGLAIDDLEQPLLSFFPDRAIAGDGPDKRAISVSHALTMTTGFDCVAEPELTLLAMQNADDWIGYALDVPMAAPPGTEWRYCSHVSHLLSAAVTQQSGEPMDELLSRELFDRIGAERPIWPRDPQGMSHGWGDARLTPTSLAHVGQLFLMRGELGEARILDESFVTAATQNNVGELGPAGGYGYAWWTSPSGVYSANGRGGQFLFVVPALDLVVVTTGGAAPEQAEALVERLKLELLAGFGDAPLAPDPEAHAALEARVEQARLPPAPKPIPEPPALASQVSATSYELEENLLGWRTVHVAFGAEIATLSVGLEGGTLSVEIGLDGVPRIARSVRFAALPRYAEIDVALSGTWLDADSFEVTFDTIDTIDAGTLRFDFGSGTLTVTLFEKTFLRAELAFSGVALP